MQRKKVEVGKKYNRLTVIKKLEVYVSPGGTTTNRYRCKCECGNIKDVLSTHLNSGKIKSCGCFNKEVCTKRIVEIGTKH